MEQLIQILDVKAYQWIAKQAYRHWRLLVLIIVLNVISALSSVAGVIASKHMIDLAVEHNFEHAIIYAVLFGSLFLIKIGFSAIITLTTAQVREKMSYQMQSVFVKRLYGIEWLELNKFHSGDVLTRLTNDVSNVVHGCVMVLPYIIALSFQLMTAFVVLLYYDHIVALFAFLLGLGSIVIGWLLGLKIKEMQHQIQSAESQYRSYLHEAVQNMLIIKAFDYEKGSMRRIRSYQQIKHQWVMRRSRFGVAANIVLSFGYRLGYFLTFCWGAFRISKGSISFGTFAAFLQLVGQIQGPFEELSGSLPQIISMISSAERLMAFELLKVEIRDSGRYPYLDKSLGIGMNNVSFAYEGKKPIITKASFYAKPGEVVALVGLSGEGKTTIIRMWLALLKPMEGSLFLEDNGSRYPITPDTRKAISYVPQGNSLFSGTIAENLVVGDPNNSMEELMNALEAACALDFVNSLPNGIHTIIGERGLGLSEGQAQRLSIARALLRKSPILLLDEVTSALDQETECAVIRNIRELKPTRTCIAITHRPSVYDLCDQVYRLNNGVLCKQKKISYLNVCN